MTQLHLFYPPKVCVDKRVDERRNIVYFGDAQYSHGDGIYHCLAQVGNSLCIVEVQISVN